MLTALVVANRSASHFGDDLDCSVRSGSSLHMRIESDDMHGMLLFGGEPGRCRSFLRLLFPKTSPDRGAIGTMQLQSSILAAKNKWGSQPCEKRVTGIVKATVER
ncbi:hypothetical protein C8J38_107100 [Rhizobium sp. PP-WC-2G-219]|nr:hypothetical protein C8J38_107100 [Rhizobium sp. PP-WC-2G-219]